MATLKSGASKVGATVGTVGDYIKEQRTHAQFSLRQLADVAGVSNPYLSQIERGLKKPSAEILQQIAKALRLSAESMYVRAGILEDRGDEVAVPAAIYADPVLSERQKGALVDIYTSFRAESVALAEATSPSTPAPAKRRTRKTAATPTTRKATAKKASRGRRATTKTARTRSTTEK